MALLRSRIKRRIKELAVEGWDEFEGKSPHRPWIDKVKLNILIQDYWIKNSDVGNPWLDAGIVPFSTYYTMKIKLTGKNGFLQIL